MTYKFLNNKINNFGNYIILYTHCNIKLLKEIKNLLTKKPRIYQTRALIL